MLEKTAMRCTHLSSQKQLPDANDILCAWLEKPATCWPAGQMGSLVVTDRHLQLIVIFTAFWRHVLF